MPQGYIEMKYLKTNLVQRKYFPRTAESITACRLELHWDPTAVKPMPPLKRGQPLAINARIFASRGHPCRQN
jgi:hypothetical protein